MPTQGQTNTSVSATTPLLPGGQPRMNNNSAPSYTAPAGASATQAHVNHGEFRLLDEPEPTVLSSLKFFAFSSYLNWLLVFVPFGVLAEVLHWPGTVVFCLNFIALVPLAKILGLATEEIALRTNETIGGLLNATFGNAVEMILCVIALQNRFVRVVQASLLGSILSNLLFVMGFSFFMGGLYYPEQQFNETAAQTGASILAVTVLAWVIPAVFANVDDSPNKLQNILTLSRATAIILLIIYALYIYFQLKTHKHLFETPENQHGEDEETPSTTLYAALGMLVLTTGVIAICAEFLVGSIDELSAHWGLSHTFVGIILLPIVGNAAEHLTAVTVAMKNKMDLSIGIGLGSSMQIALLVAPFCVLVGWAMEDVPMTLHFSTFETCILFVSVFVVNSLISDGTSNWLEGAMLVAAYVLVAIAFFLLPEEASAVAGPTASKALLG